MMNAFEWTILGVCIVLIVGLMNNGAISRKLAEFAVARRTGAR